MAYGIFSCVEKTTLYLPSDLQRSLRDEGERSGRPQAALIREAIAQYLARRPVRLPRSIGVGSDGKVGGEASERWIRKEWDRGGPSGRRRRR